MVRKKVPQARETRLVWRFDNDLAPDSHHYLPCPVLDSEMVMVDVRLFLGKACMAVWFRREESEELDMAAKNGSNWFRGIVLTPFEWFKKSSGLKEIGLALNYDAFLDEAFSQNGRSVCVRMKFDCVPGEKFTVTACKKFFALVKLLGDPKYFEQYTPAAPEISQVTHVEWYPTVWYTYAQVLWEQFVESDWTHNLDTRLAALIEEDRLVTEE